VRIGWIGTGMMGRDVRHLLDAAIPRSYSTDRVPGGRAAREGAEWRDKKSRLSATRRRDSEIVFTIGVPR